MCAGKTPASEVALVAPPASSASPASPSAPQILRVRWVHESKLDGYYWFDRYYPTQAYSAALSRDGALDWRGERRVRVVGERRVQLGEGALGRLLEGLEAIDPASRYEPRPDSYCRAGDRYISFQDYLVFELDAEPREVKLGICDAGSGDRLLHELRERFGQLVDERGWIDHRFVGCLYDRPAPYLFSTSSLSRERLGVLIDVADVQKAHKEHLALLYTASSLRDPPGAALERANQAIARIETYGGDAERCHVIEVGEGLAKHAVGDEDIGHDEWIRVELLGGLHCRDVVETLRRDTDAGASAR